jgi:hypothetical protein
VTSGTLFHSRKLPIREYLSVIALFTGGVKGVAALRMARDMNINPKSSFVLLHKLREAMGAVHEIADHVGETSPLDVSRIAYMSPGQIELSGHEQTLTEIDDLIQLVGTNYSVLSVRYNEINAILAREGLRRANPDSSFSSRTIEEFVRKRTIELAKGLNISNTENLYKMCSGNSIVMAKMVLSLCRRARGLYMFHAEGRVQPQLRVNRTDGQ